MSSIILMWRSLQRMRIGTLVVGLLASGLVLNALYYAEISRIGALIVAAGLVLIALYNAEISHRMRIGTLVVGLLAAGLVLILALYLCKIRWHADKFWHDPNPFPACTMDACFNFSHCAAMKEFRVYVYGEPISYFKALNAWSTTDASDACVFLVMEPESSSILTVFRQHFARDLPHWNGGLNHIIVSLADKWSETAPPSYSLGKASVLASCLQQTEYRPGFDLSIPLPGKKHLPRDLQILKPWERKYFLTFHGTRYVGHKEGNFRSHPAFRGMHNVTEGVIVAVTCNHETNNKTIEKHPEEGKGCNEDQVTFTQYSFEDLMNATFGLAPAGRSPSSYRMIEVLSAGAIPVIIADNYVDPFENMIQWHRCALQFPTSEMHRIVPALRAMTRQHMERRQRYCVSIYEAYLKDDATLVKSVMRSLQLRFHGVLPQFMPNEETLND